MSFETLIIIFLSSLLLILVIIQFFFQIQAQKKELEFYLKNKRTLKNQFIKYLKKNLIKLIQNLKNLQQKTNPISIKLKKKYQLLTGLNKIFQD